MSKTSVSFFVDDILVFLFCVLISREKYLNWRANIMPKRERNLRLHIMVTHEELAAIRKRMAEVNSQNWSAFLRKMMIDGYIVNVDLAPVKELLSLQRRSVNNLSQIAKYATAQNAYQSEITELQKGYDELWKQYTKLLEHLAKLVAL